MFRISSIASLKLVLLEVKFTMRLFSWLITWLVSCRGAEGFEFATLEA
jgi:hypothetical protein